MTPHAQALDDLPPSPPPISGVPMDIILVIFDILRQSCGSGPEMSMVDSSLTFDVALRWVPEVTHVCRSWREAALLASFLWTDIDFEASIPWAVEFARRSRQAPIKIILKPEIIRYQDRSPKLYECIKTLLHENRPRIREVRLHGVEDEGIISTFSDNMETGSVFFPLLESLEISIESYHDVPSLILTNHILHAPNLKMLSLLQCSVAEDFASFRNISCLSITENATSGSTMNFLRRALPQMLNLETLSLRAWDEFAVISAFDFGTQAATLPKLYGIKIDWPIELIIPILQMISCGPQRKLRIGGILAVDRPLEQALRLFTCFMSHVGSSMPQLGLLCDSSKIRVWDSQENVTTPDFSLSFGFPYHPQDPVDPAPFLLGGLLHRMNHQSLRALSLRVTLSTQSWVTIFGTLPLLDRIRINQGEQNFFAALVSGIESEEVSAERPNHANATAAALPFRGLKAVRIGGRKQPYPKKDMAFILRCLRVRKERGYKLKKLHFSSVAREDLKMQLGALKGIVGSLEIRSLMF